MVSVKEQVTTRSKDIIILLGAGASAEAKIPTSASMISLIETALRKEEKWKRFADLYNHVKSSIYYSAGLRGQFGDEVNYNIEVLVNTLYELERNESHPLYPFIASWNSRFVALAQSDFSSVRQFRELILQELKTWMCPMDTSYGDYYLGLVGLQKDLNFPLPVFSLNYDLCVERLVTIDRDVHIEIGFQGPGTKYFWDSERFDDNSLDPMTHIILYKLHGSIYWRREDATRQLFYVEQVQNIDPNSMEVIFGRDFKLEAADPYLFYAYEFRRFTLRARLIVVVGYGFGDEHINKMLVQALRGGPERRLLAVCGTPHGEENNQAGKIADRLGLRGSERDQILIRPGTAKEFLETPDLASELKRHIPVSADAPF